MNAEFRTYPQMSHTQYLCAQYVAQHPGCTIAEVHRAVRGYPREPHQVVYNAVAGLCRQGVLRNASDRQNRAALEIVMGDES